MPESPTRSESPTPRHADTPAPQPFLIERIIDASGRNKFLVLILVLFGIAGSLRRSPNGSVSEGGVPAPGRRPSAFRAAERSYLES